MREIAPMATIKKTPHASKPIVARLRFRLRPHPLNPSPPKVIRTTFRLPTENVYPLALQRWTRRFPVPSPRDAARTRLDTVRANAGQPNRRKTQTRDQHQCAPAEKCVRR